MQHTYIVIFMVQQRLGHGMCLREVRNSLKRSIMVIYICTLYKYENPGRNKKEINNASTEIFKMLLKKAYSYLGLVKIKYIDGITGGDIGISHSNSNIFYLKNRTCIISQISEISPFRRMIFAHFYAKKRTDYSFVISSCIYYSI